MVQTVRRWSSKHERWWQSHQSNQHIADGKEYSMNGVTDFGKPTCHNLRCVPCIEVIRRNCPQQCPWRTEIKQSGILKHMQRWTQGTMCWGTVLNNMIFQWDTWARYNFCKLNILLIGHRSLFSVTWDEGVNVSPKTPQKVHSILLLHKCSYIYIYIYIPVCVFLWVPEEGGLFSQLAICGQLHNFKDES